MVNYAELQRRLDAGGFSLSECWRYGNTHASYGWACVPPPQFNGEQQRAYRAGFNGKPRPILCNWCKLERAQPCQNALEHTKCRRNQP